MKIGDIVRLKTGSPCLTVIGTKDLFDEGSQTNVPGAACCWFTPDGVQHIAMISQAALTSQRWEPFADLDRNQMRSRHALSTHDFSLPLFDDQGNRYEGCRKCYRSHASICMDLKPCEAVLQ